MAKLSASQISGMHIAPPRGGSLRLTASQLRGMRLARPEEEEEEEDEDQDESFMGKLGALRERIWYGETEDPWFGRTDKEGRRQAPLMGEVRGKMGAEDILPYAAQAVSWETPEALWKIGKGVAQKAQYFAEPSWYREEPGPEAEIPEAVVREGLGAVVDLFGNPLAEDYYPVEGILNAALMATPGAKALHLPRVAKAAAIVADPLTPGIGAALGVAKKPLAKAAPAIRKVKEVVKKPVEGVSRFVKDVKIPGRTLKTEFTQAVQSFFTNMPPEFVDRMHSYAIDSNLSRRMHDARVSPKSTIDKVQQVIKDRVNKIQDAASTNFKRGKEVLIEAGGELGVSTGLDGGLPVNINKELIEFGGRLKVRWKEIVKAPDPKDPTKTVDVIVDREAMMDRLGGFTDEAGRQVALPPDDVFKWDVEWLKKEATMGTNAEEAVQKHIRKMLNSKETINGERALSVQQGLTYIERQNSVIAAMKRKHQPAARLTSRLRETNLAAIDKAPGLPKDARAYMGEYGRQQKLLNQIEADFGVKPRMDDISRKQLKKKLQSAFDGEDAMDNVDKLESLIGKEGVADIVGAAHFGAFGGGLVVRSEFSNIIKIVAGTPLIAGGAGIAGVALGPLGALAGGIITTIPLVVLISPRAMLEVTRILGRNPKWRKAISGRGDVKISPEALQKLITNVRQIAQKLKAKNIDVKTLAAQGMTLGQLLQRLEPE